VQNGINHLSRLFLIGLVGGGGFIAGAVLDHFYNGIMEAVASGSLIVAVVMALVYTKDICRIRTGMRNKK